MKSRKMFEMLGYKQDKNNEELIVYERNSVFVVFEKGNKSYHTFEYYHGYKLVVYNTIATHQAIHQQMIELGWIE